jgi:hypothetical protein
VPRAGRSRALSLFATDRWTIDRPFEGKIMRNHRGILSPHGSAPFRFSTAARRWPPMWLPDPRRGKEQRTEGPSSMNRCECTALTWRPSGTGAVVNRTMEAVVRARVWAHRSAGPWRTGSFFSCPAMIAVGFGLANVQGWQAERTVGRGVCQERLRQGRSVAAPTDGRVPKEQT